MKYGNFVSEKQLELTQQEKDIFYKYFINLLHKYNIPVSFEKVEQVSMNGYVFMFKDAKPINGRNLNKDRVKEFYGLFFMVRKNVGFLDVTDWTKDKKCVKDYDNAPQFQYSVQLALQGSVIPYKKKRTRSMFTPNSYQYGTEFSDIDFNLALQELQKILTIK